MEQSFSKNLHYFDSYHRRSVAARLYRSVPTLIDTFGSGELRKLNELREQIREAELSTRMEQRCITCCVNRRLVGTEPVTKDYEIQFLECPGCRTVVRLVNHRVASRRSL